MEDRDAPAGSSSTRKRAGITRSLTAIVALCVVSLVAASCLAPDEYDPTGNEPVGFIDIARAAGSSIRVSGWALDPNIAGPVQVTVSYLGKQEKITADKYRPDVGAAYPGYGNYHGFDYITSSFGSGVGKVCLWIENVGAGSRGRLLGCREVQVGSDAVTGAFESAVATSLTTVRVSGWALTPNNPFASAVIREQINGGAWGPYRSADQPRAGLNQSLGIPGDHGFSYELVVPQGVNQVCMLVHGNGGPNTNLGCRTVAYESVSPVAPGADLLSVSKVKPAPGHVLEQMSRDAGVSTRLSDGSSMWFFGDTSDFNSNGSLKYFVNNTSAWASTSDPATTTDAVAPGPAPFLSMTPKEPFTAPCPSGWNAVLWPSSAVTVPKSATEDKVLVYFANMCLGGEWKFEPRGMGVAEFTYDRTAPPRERPVQGRIVTQTIFPANQRYGTAALFDDGFIYTYQCRTPEADGQIHWPDDPLYGPCTVARVAPDDVGTLSKYRYFANGTWSENAASATPMTVPGSGVDKSPPSGFSITKDSHHGFLLVYSPWPGLTKHVSVRKSATPVGPWSTPQSYTMPGCEDAARGVGRFCYAATAQPAFSAPGRIGIGYFDDLTTLSPIRGSYLAGTVATRW